MTLLAVLIALVFLYGLVSARLERTILTAPILFTAAGVAANAVLPALPRHADDMEVLLRVAEIGLVMLLFTDASRTDLVVLKNIRSLPVRLLSTGMLLTLLLGAVAARLVFPGFSLWEAGILAAILAPTDAGLGQIVVSSPRVPMRVRQALNVEAGLNDGLSVPFLLFFMALAGAGAGGRSASLTRFMVEQLGFGALIGVGIGLGGGILLRWASGRGWVSESFLPLGVATLPLFCMVTSEAAGASMFIAAFVAGLAVQVGFREAGGRGVEFIEQCGQLFNLTVFFLFGLLLARAWPEFGWAVAAYAVLSLTVVRMIPVAIALLGTRLSRATVVFMGWFGPRGLASIVLALVYLQGQAHLPGENVIRLTVMATVALSIFAHGLTAIPGIDLYAAKVAALGAGAPEREAAAPGAPGRA
jgi:NhaP-type Na+/H+ or K+/H+ antiporter